MFEIVHLGLNFVSDLAQVGGSEVYSLLQYFAVNNDPLRFFLEIFVLS